MLESGVVDMALTYIPQAELRLMQSGAASKRSYVYRVRSFSNSFLFTLSTRECAYIFGLRCHTQFLDASCL